MKLSVKITQIFLLLVSIMHILRFIFNVEVKVANTKIPLYFSFLAAILTLFLAIFLQLDGRRK